MGKFIARQTIIVEPENKEDVQKVWDWLLENIEFDRDGEWKDIYNETYIEGWEEVSGWYEPEVRYTANGDGNPEIIELDGGCEEEWLQDEIKENLGVECRVTCNLRETDYADGYI